MPTIVSRETSKILARHAEIDELVELNRIAGNWQTVARKTHVIDVPAANCVTDDTVVVVIGRDDDADVLALRDAAVAQDKDAIGVAYLRFGARLEGVAERAGAIALSNVHGVCDLTYAGRTVLRNVVVDHVVGFNMFAFAFAGGRLDGGQFRLIEQRIREDAPPLTAVLLVKERPLSPMEEEAERVAPMEARTAVILPRIVADFIDDIVDAAKNIGGHVADAAKDVGHTAVAVAKVLGCQIKVDVANPNVVAQHDAQERVDQNVAQRIATATVDDLGPYGVKARYLLDAPVLSDLNERATIDELIDYRARVFRSR